MLKIDKIDEILKILIEKKYDDHLIYSILKDLYDKKEIKYDPLDSAIKRAEKTSKIIQNILKKQNIKNNLNKYLDIGCEECITPTKIGEKIDSNDINCINIQNWESTYNLKNNNKYKCNFKYYDGINIPFDRDSIDFCTILMVIHHIEHFDKFLINLNRVMKKNSYLVIKEHNVINKDFAQLCDIQHYIYDEVYFGKKMEKYSTRYYSIKDLKKELSKHGFNLLYLEYLNKNVQSYIALFQKDG
jgi:ubiquinone/menaquinone biosynthesis C-methylase UbiE